MGVPLVFIHVSWNFHEINHPTRAILVPLWLAFRKPPAMAAMAFFVSFWDDFFKENARNSGSTCFVLDK